MSERLQVRDVVEQLGKMDPGLFTNITNIAEIVTGSFQDGTRVRLYDEQQVDDRNHQDIMTELARQRREESKEIFKLEQRKNEVSREMADERAAHEQKLEALRTLCRRIKESALQRILPLP